jgi:two-component system response regulator HydG
VEDGEMILFIDDDMVLHQLISKVFEVNSYEVTCMNNGKDAIAWLAKGNLCNLIITDMHMQNGSGVELINWAKEHGSKIPIIIVTGDETSTLDQTQNCPYIKGLPVMSKPFNTKQLIQKVKTYYRTCGLKCG